MPIYNRRLVGELATAESITAKDSNYVNIFGLDFAFSFAKDIAKTSSLSRLKNIQQSLLDRVIVVLIIILVNKTQLLLILGDRLTPSTLLAKFIPITKIRDLFLKTLENAAKSRILLACVDRRIRQYYLTILLLTSVKKNCYYTRCTKYYNFNIYVSLATDTLHLLLKGLQKVIIQQLIAIISLLFILKAPFALYFICAVYDLHALTHIIQDICMYKALDSICTRANSEAYYITIKEYILQICLHNSRRTVLLAANYATIPYSTKLPLSKVAVNIAISNFIYAAAQSSSKRYNNSKYCNEELYLILIIINYTYYDKDRKYIAYIKAFSKVLLFNNNKQINNTTRILSMPFKFYNLSTIICLVHLVLRDLPNLITYTTMSYYVNNYIN
ncbi:hypothetical protein HBI23_251720 [Parastagonospora nodorum]|nr:hypothetical protein HBI23_251720 [Parastagonospora nodorum]